MATYEISTIIRAVDETAAGTAAAKQHLEAVDQAAKQANKDIAGMGHAATQAAHESGGPLSKFKDSLGEIGKIASGFVVGQLASQLTQGLGEAISSSIDKTKEFYGETKKLMMITGGTAETTSTLVAAFERYGVSAKQASTSFGLFAKQLQKAPVDLEEMGSGLDANGKPLKGFAQVMSELGVATEDSTGKTRSMQDTLLDVADSFKEMGTGPEAAAKAMTLFGRAGKDMLPVLMQGREGIQEAMDTAAKYGLQLTTENMGQIKQFSFAQKDMTEALEGVKLQMGIALMPVLAALARAGATLAQTFNQQLMPVIRNFADLMKQVGGVVGTVLSPLGMLGELIGKLTGLITGNEAVMKLLSFALTMLGTIVGALTIKYIAQEVATYAVATATKLWTLATEGLSGAMEILDAVMAMNPLGLIVIALVAIAAAAVWAYNNIDWFKDLINALTEAFTGDAGAMGVVYDVIRKVFGDGVAEFLQPFLQWFMTAIPLIKDLWSALVEAFSGDAGAMGVVYDIIRKLFGDSVAEFLQPFLNWIMEAIPAVKDFLGSFLGIIGELGPAFGNLFGGNFTGAMEDFGQAFTDMGQLLGPVVQNLISWIQNQVPVLLSGFRDWVEAILEAVEPLIGAIVGKLKGLVTTVFAGLIERFPMLAGPLATLAATINNVLNFIARTFKDVVDFVDAILHGDWRRALADAVDFVAQFGQLLITQLQIWARAFVSWILPAIANLISRLPDIIAAILNWINEVNPIIVETLFEWEGAFLGWIGHVLQGLLPALAGLIGFIIGWLIEEVPKLVETLGQWTEAFLSWIGDAITHLPENLAKLVQAIKDWVQGGGAQQVGEAGKSFGEKFWDAFKELILHGIPDLIGNMKDSFLSNIQAGRTTAQTGQLPSGDLGGQDLPPEAGELHYQGGGWLKEPIVGVGASGTRYRLHGGEFVSPAGSLAAGAAAAHGGRSNSVTLNVHPGAVQISGANGPSADWAAAADGLWDDLYSKLSRALDNRTQGVGAQA